MKTPKITICEAGKDGCGGITTAIPTFYMNDWSQLALRVNDLQSALGLLQQQDVEVEVTPSGATLYYASLDQIPQIVTFLNREGIYADLSDRIVQVYQG